MTTLRPPDSPPSRPVFWWWLTASIATALIGMYALGAYLALGTAKGLAEVMSGLPGGAGRLDGCCQRPPAGSRVERDGRRVAAIVQVGTVPPTHLMMLAPRFERGSEPPDTTFVGRLARVESSEAALVVELVPRDAVVGEAPAATLVLGPERRLVSVYRPLRPNAR